MNVMTRLNTNHRELFIYVLEIEENVNHNKGMLKCSSCIRWFLPVCVTLKPFHVCKVAAMPSELFLSVKKERAT